MNRSARQFGVGAIAGLMVVGLLPLTVLAATPVAASGGFTTAEDTAHLVTLTGTDDDGDNLTFAMGSGPSHGTLSSIDLVGCSGSPSTCTAETTYTPDPNYHGSDSFTFSVSDGTDTGVGSVTVTVSSVNDDPVATDDPTNPIDEDVTTILNVRANDDDIDGDTLTITGKTNGTKGAVTINSGATVSYNPNSNATGIDTFTYTINDGHGGTATATVSVQISSVNDAPVAHSDPINPIVEDTTTTLDLLSNDTDPDGDSLAITGTSGVSLGVVTITSGGGDVSYDPNPNATGSDSFTYAISDGHGGTDTATATVQISAQNDGPVAFDDSKTIAEDSGPTTINVTGNDVDPDGPSLSVIAKTNPSDGTLTLVSGVLTYTPAHDFNGSDGFDYTVSDGTDSDDATVTITVTPVNDPPDAVDDTITLTEDPGPTTIVVLGNDGDVDGDTPSVTAKTNPTHGTLTLVSGVLTYTPVANYHGSDTFTYTISDGVLTDTANVALTITSQNDVPDAVDDVVTIPRDTAANAINVLGNDTDDDGDAKTITAKTDGAKGTVVITGGGTGLTYDPFTGYLGADSFTYTISDGNGGFDTATVSITITGANRAPNAVNDVGLSVPEGAGPTSLLVMANDDDPDGDTFTITARTNGAHGVVAIGPGGAAVTYDPATRFHGTDTFTYTIRDAGGMTDTATVVVTVTRDTTAPVVTAPAQRLLLKTVGTSTVTTRIAWSAADPGSGIRSYQVQASVNGGPFQTIALASPTRTFVDRVLTNNASYRYRVRATDNEGNVSAWRAGPLFRPAVFQETTSVATYVGAWSTYRSAGALGGAERYTATLGKTVRFANTAYDLALVMTRTATSGTADIYVDGVLATRLDLRDTRIVFRQLMFTRHFATLGPHTIEIRPTGSGRVDIDAFLVLR